MNDWDDFDFEENNDEVEENGAAGVTAEENYKKGIFRIVYQSNTFFIPQLRSMLKDKTILNLRPEYQRRLRWDNKRKSLLIESLLLNIPIPPLFFHETEMASYEVMDGQQRLNAIKEFLGNEFRIYGLKVLSDLNGKFYKDIHPVFRKGFDRASISVNVLLLESEEKEKDPKKIRKYVFERLNTGGKRLNDQEIRNCIYSGRFNDLILELSREETFTSAWSIPAYDPAEGYESPKRKRNVLYKNMYDCQLVLRFFALQNDADIKGSLKAILDRCMESNRSITTEDEVEYEDVFLRCIDAACGIFGKHPFRVRLKSGGEKDSAPLYDAIMVAISRNTTLINTFKEKKSNIRKRLNDALSTGDGYDLLVGRGNTAQAIKDRISAIEDILHCC